MKIDVSELLKDFGAEQEVSGSEKLSFKDDGLNLSSPVEIKLKLINTGKTVLVTGDLKTKAKLCCCRCLKDFEYPVNIKIDEEYRKKRPVPRKQIKGNEEIELKENDFFFEIADDNVIDLDEAIRQDLIVSLPIKPLCSKQCTGLKELELVNKRTIDPRLAKLKSIKLAGGK